MEISNSTSRRSIRILMIMAIDILIMSFAFLALYTYISGQTKVVFSGVDVYFAMGIYDVLFFLSICACGGYLKKTISSFRRFVTSVVAATVISHLICSAIFFYLNIHLAFGMVLLATFSGMLILLSRVLQKFFYDRYVSKAINKTDNDQKIPTLIIGAGFTGKMVYRELTEDSNSTLMPVCFVDDDKNIVSTEICGLNVYGPTVLIPQLCKKHNIGMIIFAIPSCSSEERYRILANCQDLDCDVRIVPSLSELTYDQAFVEQAHEVDIEKLLGRDSISIENTKVAEFINNKVCLVTGGGGSIGSELCRQIVRMKPKQLVIVDIYENNAYEIQQELKRSGFGDDLVKVEISSVRDKEKMRTLFIKYGFDVVFHAAAHKHVPLMEFNPEEAVKNNIAGTYNIAHLSHKYGVKKMVLISTDKAVNPTNVMGATKRACEMVMQYMSQRYSDTKYTAVRFGNVLGSNGSVIPLFTKQILAGGPVTVTHPDIIRYFMTIPEAVSLVLEAGTMSNGGETFVLDMGEPVKIVTLAENLIKMHGYQPYTQMPIEFCGLREGEKLFEELLMNEENLKETYNKKIFISNQLVIDCDTFKSKVEEIIATAKDNNPKKTVELLHDLIPTFKTPDEINKASKIDAREKAEAVKASAKI